MTNKTRKIKMRRKIYNKQDKGAISYSLYCGTEDGWMFYDKEKVVGTGYTVTTIAVGIENTKYIRFGEVNRYKHKP